MTYAAYLRIYEPVSAFHEPDRSRWAAHAASATGPGRRDPLSAERAEARYRAITVPHIAVPEQDSESVAEIGAALDGLARGECELAIAMHKRAHSRWRAFAPVELAN